MRNSPQALPEAVRGETGLVQSVDRAIAVLDLLARNGWSGATEVARVLGVHKSTAFRLLATLERHGMVEQHGQTAKYRPGPRIRQLASVAVADLDLRRNARRVCEALAKRTGETVTLDAYENDEVVHIDQAVGSSSVVSVNWLGRRTPLHCTASGKVFLAFAPEDMQRRVLRRRLKGFTPNTLTEPAVLRKQLDAVRLQGYGYTLEELEIGLNAVAAPVRSADGVVVAAVNLSGPSHRLPRERFDEFAAMTMDSAADVAHRIGYRPH